MARHSVVSKTFSGTGQSEQVHLIGSFAFRLSNFGSATITLKRRGEDGSFQAVSKPDLTAATFTADTPWLNGFEPTAGGALYLFDCTAYASGSPLCEIVK